MGVKRFLGKEVFVAHTNIKEDSYGRLIGFDNNGILLKGLPEETDGVLKFIPFSAIEHIHIA